MRCKCCDVPLINNDSPAWNKLAQKEEDLCSVCRNLVYNSYTEREYCCGRYPVDGVTGPVPIKEN
ncbi:hypothetical protein phiPsa267_051 [Pseudomonas phage phiPsa267]|jgi:hypothetical protein|uniref:Uncharacterized protein n=8 Tax=Gorskivirinae TaxID=3152211 RepID=A0A7G9V149_9CAUD|nr:hypothetical protein QGX16_gp050 [Pseudomonas phage phiPsa397]YP_010767312.1 hypothetical protein QGX17_gp049 [Pseudomonas phage phiPsa381]YP_010767488.1 hypothetical protein QGX18_gp052 [Pseudomonas phage phiPsa347]YP_010767661.1 hypothetical protein QGX19_gp051 [Pseudomonas phage phiPsa267]YP_010767835.1 hypothetical protein QGX20_gp049 [Pseudomonas phage phiPsa300]YP_010768009.1 hypothetical protein QGX21_gp052 [Pseudomonas phage phiPsa315]YP_010768183.1 hypothetical protein QGX22_gp054